MNIVIHGKNIEIIDAIREYVNEKIDKAVSHFQSLTNEVNVHLSVARNPRINPNKQSAEVTIYANGTVIRAEESSDSLYASIDLVADKITRQLRKYKERRLDQKTQAQVKTGDVVEQQPVAANLVGYRTPELPNEVVRTKYFAIAPMTMEQALEQLQLVGHDFYMYRNAETGEINVIYERNHGGYGVIEPRNGNGHTNQKNGKVPHNQTVAPEKSHHKG